jgi:glycosyltransferase involved in cell wall biosynthesis
VAPVIAERYQQEFGMSPVVILNAPSGTDLIDMPEKDFNDVKLIHHGVALPDRRLEEMIKTIVLCDKRYSLHFMLAGNNPDYVQSLKKMAGELAPGRVSFHLPVAPEDIVTRLSAFHMGFCFIAPTNYNYLVCLPNKFFDFIAAGLPVCIGPSPSMLKIVESYKLGCAARSFEPGDIADALNRLTSEQFVEMSRGARAAARELNADHEMGKLVKVYEQLLVEAQ